MLPTPLEKLQILVKGVSEKSLPHPSGHQFIVVFLRLLKFADTYPFPHGDTELPVIQFTHSFIHKTPLSGPDELLVEPKLLLVLHSLKLQLLIDTNVIQVLSLVQLVPFVERIGFPVEEIGCESTFA